MIRTAGLIKPYESGIADMADKPFWDTDTPKDAKEKHLSRKNIQSAKARARAAGRPYPNLVDNAAVARSKGK